MREHFFRFLLSVMERHMPGAFRRMELQLLTDLASVSFGVPGKRVWHLRPDRALEEYGLFTADCMRQQEYSRERLYRQAYVLGNKIRVGTGLTEEKDLQRLVFLLYRGIGIDMEGRLPGGIRVNSCYFSELYSPEECACMSAVDAGVIAGIFGGGSLQFTQRITEGCGCCLACFECKKGRAGA